MTLFHAQSKTSAGADEKGISGCTPAPCLKRGRHGAQKLLGTVSHCLHGLVHPHHAQNQRHVHFKQDRNHGLITVSRERPTTTPEEKQQYHYSIDELHRFAEEARAPLPKDYEELVQAQDDIILFQGYLYFPEEMHLFHAKHYYCLLRSHDMYFYTTPENAARNTHLKAQYTIKQVIDCQMMSKQEKVAKWGAHFPSTLPNMFFIVQPNGQRVLIATDSRQEKRNWFHALSRLNYADYVVRRHGTYATGTTYVVGTADDECGDSCADDNDSDTISTVSSSPENSSGQLSVTELVPCMECCSLSDNGDAWSEATLPPAAAIEATLPHEPAIEASLSPSAGNEATLPPAPAPETTLPPAPEKI